jgi:hypothetical protein
VVGWQFYALEEGGRPAFGASPEDLVAALQVEFIAIHATAFLFMFGLSGDSKLVRAISFWGLFAFYAGLAYATSEKHFLLFIGLTFVTYLGMFLNWRSPSAMLQLGARWFVAFTFFMYVTNYYGTTPDVGSWTSQPAVMAAGRFYFFGLAAVELTGFYLRWIPRNGALFLEAIRRLTPRF